MKRKSLVFLSVAAAALVFVSAAWAIRFTDESYFAPVGTVGSPYSFTFTGAGGCGPALPYQFSLIGGTLPPGLTLASSGTVSGTPTNAGGWSFWVNLSDQNPPSASWCVVSEAQREFTITINGTGGSPNPGPGPAPAPTPALSISTSGLPEAMVGAAYSTTLSASGGSGTKTWTVAAGSLPAGLSLSANGVVSGTPTAPGTASFTAKVAAGGASAQRQFSLGVTAGLAIGAPTTKLAEVAVPLTIELNAAGGSAPYRWELTQGSLPTHVGFIGDQGNGSTALIKGVPATSGSFPLTFRVTDVLGRSTLHTITVDVADKLRLTAKLPRSARVAKLYRAHGVAEGGYGKRTWSIAGGVLPAGLQLDSKTGFITGRPARRGSYVFYLVAKDELGASRSLKISIVVRP
jgi:hypothetical protein